MLKWKRGRPAVGKEQSAVEAQKLIRIESVNRKQKPSRLRRLLSCFGAKYDLTQFPKFDQDDNHNAKGKSRSVRSSRRRRKEVDLESKSSETAPESAMSNAKQVQQLEAFTELKVAKCDVLPPVQKNDEESLGTGAAGDGKIAQLLITRFELCSWRMNLQCCILLC